MASGGASRKGGKPISARKLMRRTKELIKEARSLLKRKRKRVSEGAGDVVREAMARAVEVAKAARGNVKGSREALMGAAVELDEAIEETFGRWRKSQTREFIEAILWALGLAAIIRFFLIEAFSIPSSSMMPTLQIGDHLFVNKIGHGLYWPLSPSRMIAWDQPSRGDIIVFRHHRPGGLHHGEDYIKRVIGVPGDTVALRENRLYLNGEAVPTRVIGEVDCPVFRGQNDEVPALVCRCVQQEETLDGQTYVSQHLSEVQHERDCAMQQRSPDWPQDVAHVVVPDGHVFVMGDNRDYSEDARFWGTSGEVEPSGRCVVDRRVVEVVGCGDGTIDARGRCITDTCVDYGFVHHDRIKGSAFVIWWARDKSRLFNTL